MPTRMTLTFTSSGVAIEGSGRSTMREPAVPGTIAIAFISVSLFRFPSSSVSQRASCVVRRYPSRSSKWSPCPYQKPRSYGFWLMKSFHDSPNSLHWARTCSVAAFKRHKQSKRTTCPRPRGAKSGGCLGGDSFVAMMESADLWDLHDPTHGLRLDRTADGCVLAQ